MYNQSERILTWQPRGRKGAYISAKNYQLLRDFILQVLKTQEITLKELIDIAEVRLAHEIEKDISWNILMVKLDLEARGLIGTVVKWAPFREQVLKLKARELKKINALHARA